MAWEKERIEKLLELNKQRYSASQIAQKLGFGATRNAVIGKLNRMGLSCGGGRPGLNKPSNASNGASNQIKSKRIAAKLRPALVEVPKQPQPAERDIGIEDLSDSICRFPMGDPAEKGFRFCGAKKPMDDLPYCNHHNQLSHQRSTRVAAKNVGLAKRLAEEKQQKRKTG